MIARRAYRLGRVFGVLATLAGIGVSLGLAGAHVSSPTFGGGDNCGPATEGHEHSDDFDLLGGDDCAHTYAGNDVIDGGGQADSPLSGGGDGDVIRGDAHADKLFGGDGIDDMTGGDQGDDVQGGAAGDDLTGGSGADQVDGIDNHVGDVVRGGSDNDFDVCDIDHNVANNTYDQTSGCDAYNINDF